MTTKLGQDLSTGLLFAAIGIGALWIGADYSMGTPQRPGTGVLPFFLSWGLIGIGAALAIKSVLSGDTPVAAWAWRPLAAVTLGTVAFGYLIDDLGLILTMIVSLTLGAAGTPETRWKEYLVFLGVMLLIGVGTFIWLLGMPIPTWPAKMSGFLKMFGR